MANITVSNGPKENLSGDILLEKEGPLIIYLAGRFGADDISEQTLIDQGLTEGFLGNDGLFIDSKLEFFDWNRSQLNSFKIEYLG